VVIGKRETVGDEQLEEVEGKTPTRKPGVRGTRGEEKKTQEHRLKPALLGGGQWGTGWRRGNNGTM
jgi:hypothetical protein